MIQKNYEILCVKRIALPLEWQKEPFAHKISLTDLSQLFENESVWKPRDQVEQDPDYKQLIPYLLARIPDGRLACYKRFGNEKRLHGLWSSGLGGHIERIDQKRENNNLIEIIENCAHREFFEEFINPEVLNTRFLGIINEEVTKVGRVHLGIVFLFDLTRPANPGEELNELQWLPPYEHAKLKSELWSQLALDLFIQSHPLHESQP